jgi:hypothetical protein
MNLTDTRTLIPILIVVLALIVLLVFVVLTSRKRKSERLRHHFGTEYDRVVSEYGDPGRAEAALLEREKRVHKFSIHTLPTGDRERFLQDWATVQKRFVDDPAMAVTDADRLVTAVMAARGYPMADFEQRAADISVTYPEVVDNYRAARQIVLRHGKGQATTEELRRAMVHYHALFEELLDSPKLVARGVSHGRIAS